MSSSHRFRSTKFLSVKMLMFSYLSVLTYVLSAQKNRLIQTVLLSTHNICFGLEIRKLIFRYALLAKVLSSNYNVSKSIVASEIISKLK